MRPYELFILCATAVTVVFVVVYYYFRTRHSKAREQVISKWHRLIQAMIESENGSGDLGAFNKLDLLVYEMSKHSFTHADIDVLDMDHVRRIAYAAYSRGLAKLKATDPTNVNLRMLRESLVQFRRCSM